MNIPKSNPTTNPRVEASKKVPLICSGHSRPVPYLSYSPITPDGFFMISACLDSKPMLRNGQTGDWIGTFIGHKGAVWSAHLNSNALQAVTGSADYTAKLWDALTGNELHSFTHPRIVKSSHFSHDSQQILTGGQDRILRIFDIARPDAEPQKLEGHTDSIKIALWSPIEDRILVSGGQDGVLRIWDTRSLRQIKEQPIHTAISSVEICDKYITTTSGKQVIFWDIKNFEIFRKFTLPLEINSASLAPDCNTFVVGGNDFSVRVYDFETGNELELHKGHHGPVNCVRFAPDGATFSSGSDDGTIRILQSRPRVYGLWQEIEQTFPDSLK